MNTPAKKHSGTPAQAKDPLSQVLATAGACSTDVYGGNLRACFSKCGVLGHEHQREACLLHEVCKAPLDAFLVLLANFRELHLQPRHKSGHRTLHG